MFLGKTSGGKLNQREEEEHRPSPRASFSLKAHDISTSSLCIAAKSVRTLIITFADKRRNTVVAVNFAESIS
jgi:hypothetical protein